MTDKWYFICGPYTGKTPDEIAANIAHAKRANEMLVGSGAAFVFCPHMNWAGLETTLSYHLFTDMCIRALIEIPFTHIYMLDGWEDSGFPPTELTVARCKGIEVIYESIE